MKNINSEVRQRTRSVNIVKKYNNNLNLACNSFPEMIDFF